MMKDSAPFLSIVIVTKDRPSLLKNCLDHLQGLQLGVSFDVIVVDGSSGADSQNVVVSHPLKASVSYLRDSKKKYYNFPQVQVPSSAVITGAHYAKGKFITQIGDDDYFEAAELARVCDTLQNDPTYTGFIGHFVAWDDVNQEVMENLCSPKTQATHFGKEDGLGILQTLLSAKLYGEFYVYQRQHFLNCFYFLPNAYPSILWAYFMAAVGKIGICQAPLVRQTRRSLLYKAGEAAQGALFARELSIGASISLELAATYSLTRAPNLQPLKDADQLRYHMRSFVLSTLCNSAQAAMDGKDFTLAYTCFMRLYYYTAADTLFIAQNFIMENYPKIFPHFLTALIIQKFQLLVGAEKIVLWGFNAPNKITEESFHFICPHLPVVFRSNKGRVSDVALAAGDRLVVTPLESQQERLVHAGAPRAHTVSLEQLAAVYRFPPIELTLDF